MNYLEQRIAAHAAAQQKANAIADTNAYWAAQAALVRDRENKTRESDRKARDEVVRFFHQSEGRVHDVVLARMNFGLAPMAADELVPREFIWAPVGTSDLSGAESTGAWCGTVVVDEAAYAAVAASFAHFKHAGAKPYIDFGHNEASAAGIVAGFSWDPARGIICEVDWLPVGERVIRERIFASFSPRFRVDGDSGQVLGLHDGNSAGGLVNTPAFASMPPISASGRSGCAQLLRETLLRAGYPAQVGAVIANAVRAGDDDSAVAAYVALIACRPS